MVRRGGEEARQAELDLDEIVEDLDAA